MTQVPEGPSSENIIRKWPDHLLQLFIYLYYQKNEKEGKPVEILTKIFNVEKFSKYFLFMGQQILKKTLKIRILHMYKMT